MTVTAIATSPLQVGWTGDALVAWWWDGRAVLGRAGDGSRVYGELVNQFGWLPSGSAAMRIEAALPSGMVTIPAIGLPPAAWRRPRSSSRRGPSASVRWMDSAVALAGWITGSGRAVPELHPTGSHNAYEASWVVAGDPAIDAAVATLAAGQPPVVRAVAPLGSAPTSWDGDGSDDGSLAATTALVEWLVDRLARGALRQLRWVPPLKGLRGPEATAARAMAAALTGTETRIVPGRADASCALGVIADALSTMRARIAGEPVLDVRLRLGLPGSEPSADAAGDGWPLAVELVDRLDASRWCSANDVWQGTALAEDLAGDPGHLPVLEEVLRAARRRLASSAPLACLAAVLDPDRPIGGQIDIAAASQLIGSLAALTELGISVQVPGQLVPAAAKVRGKARVAPPAAAESRLGAQALVSWSMVVDGAPVDPAVLERAVAAGSSLLNVDGRWVQLDPTSARKALAELARHQHDHALVGPAELLRLAAEAGSPSGGLFDSLDAADDGAAGTTGDDAGWVGDLLAGLPDASLGPGEVPAGFVAELRPYQQRAVGWMQFLARVGLGGCLADDMGLGKTPTTLAHLAGRPGPHLVVCPLSVVRNWEMEAARFTPSMKVLVHHGTGRRRGDALVEELRGAELVVSTYGLVARDLDHLGALRWTTVVLDEAQAIKNPHTKAARAVRKLVAAQKLALTGTPVENRLGELWSILEAVNPGLLGSEHRFRERFALPIERDGDEHVAARLRRLTSPFVLRRTKADRSLVPDLPDKVEQVAWATLTAEQAAMYQAVTDELLRAAERAEGIQRRGLVLAALTRLKQVCNHPAHALGDGSRLAGRSGKLARFDELIADLLDAGEQALVFTQYRAMGEILQRHLGEQRGLRVPFLHGGVAKSRRDAMVDAFQSGRGGPLLIVSLKAGGTGLNLTAASRVVHYDRWWNPAVEDQATDRAWRIGQRQAVFVHKLVCQGTLEERIAQLIDDKRRLAGMVVGTGEAWLSELSTAELRDLVTLDAGERR